jgi:uncharacterized Zn finger protein
MSVYTAILRCPTCGKTQETWVRRGKFLPNNTTACENCQKLYPADENLFQVFLANSVVSSLSMLNANV